MVFDKEELIENNWSVCLFITEYNWFVECFIKYYNNVIPIGNKDFLVAVPLERSYVSDEKIMDELIDEFNTWYYTDAIKEVLIKDYILDKTYYKKFREDSIGYEGVNYYGQLN